MSGVGILCFAASYAVALCLEISRIFFRSPIRSFLTLFWILAGLIAHTAYLYYNHAVSPVPIDGAESYFLVSAWGLVLVYLYLFCFHSKIPFGFVLLPISLLLIGGAVLVPESLASESPTSASLWKRLHAGTFFLATLSVCVGFVAGILYFVQDRRLRQKRPPTRFLQLPTLEWSLSVCRQAIGASIFLLGACIFSGFLLRSTDSKPFSAVDPLVWGTLLLFVFLLVFSGVLSLRFFKTEGRYVAVLTLVSFLFLVSILLFGVLFRDAHWKRGLPTEMKRPGLTTTFNVKKISRKDAKTQRFEFHRFHSQSIRPGNLLFSELGRYRRKNFVLDSLRLCVFARNKKSPGFQRRCSTIPASPMQKEGGR